MLKLLGFLISGCWHKWRVINQETVNYSTDFSKGTADRYILQCEHCGNIKTKLAK